MHVIEHHIQREIIDRLKHAEHLRFKELKPGGMESNIFMYHLKQLIKQGFVTKTDIGYTLASQGLRYVDNLSSDGNRPHAQPKTICILYIKNKEGDTLVAQRKTQPFIGKYMLPSGKQRLEESFKEHVRRELQEKFAISEQAIRRGTAEIMLYETASHVLLTHIIGQVYEVKVESVDTPPETERYVYSWHRNVDKLDFLPGTQELIKKLHGTKGSFFFSYRN